MNTQQALHRINNLSVLFVITFVLGFISVSAAAGQMSCRDLDYGNTKYHQKMDELARRARLPDNYWSRFHEDLVRDLCRGDIGGVNSLVDNGSVKPSEAQSIGRVLGKVYKPKQRSRNGKSYGYSRQQFEQMGACSVCADNIAQFYTKKPASRCGRLARQSHEGDPEAIEKVLAWPAYCAWKY